MILNNIDFIGFSNSINVFVLVLVVVLAFILTFYAYSFYSTVSFRNKLGLMSLRILAFGILILLLANPVFERTQIVLNKPIVTILIDNSASLGANSPSWNGLESYTSVLANISQIDTELYTHQIVFFNSSIEDSANIESFQLQGAQTDIYDAIRTVLTDYSSDEIILITDGISTRGRDPLFSAQDNRTPIHTIAVGDSTLKKDVILQEVDFPRTTLINTPNTISASIRNVDITQATTLVKLFQDDTLLESKSINLNQPNSIQQVDFQIEYDSPGIYNYSIEVDSVGGEWTTLNNTRSFEITAKDDQIKILYISTELHPDVGGIRNLIQSSESFDMLTRTWIRGNQFVEGPLPTRRDTLDLVIIHGLNESLPGSVVEFIEESISSTNTLFINTPGTGSRPLNSVYGGLSIFTASEGPNRVNLQLNPSTSSSGHVVTDIPQINWSRTPLLRTNLSLSNVSERLIVLLNATDRITQQNYPAIGLTSMGSQRHSFVLFSGINNLLLTSNQSDQISFQTLFSNLITWTSTSNFDENFEVTLSENEFSANNEILVNARIVNELGLPENEATITLRLESDTEVENRTYVFRNVNSGNYQLEIPSLPIGNYKFEAIAEKSQQNLGTQLGSFTVGNTQSEFINTLRNDALLRSLAEFTQGNFIQYDKLQDINSLLTAKDPISETKSTIFQLFRSPIWFFVLILLLGIEWFLRRRVLIP
ncbi:MAG TPA: hypothetical protein DCE78_11960 [Bacteroidetes bacterium]|nr:hypothetical protein [Bacteroidota bacterium]